MTITSFKDYLESKNRLKESIKNNPVFENSYSVNSYCKLPVLDGDKKDNILLKPTSKIIIEWKYENQDVVTPLSIRFMNSNASDENKYKTSWSGDKMKKWLSKHVELDYIF